MKKLISILVLIVLLIPVATHAAIANSSSLSDVRVYVVTNEKCKECDKEIEWLKSIKSEYIRLSVISIDSESDEELITKIKEALKIKKDDLPLTILGTNYFIGYDDKIKDNIANAIESYNDYDKHCELVTKLKNDEDITECIKENEDIYKEPSNKMLVIIIIVIVLLIIIIFLLIYLIKIKKIDILKLIKKE